MFTPSSQLKFCTCLQENNLEAEVLREKMNRFLEKNRFRNKKAKNGEKPFIWTLEAYKGLIDYGATQVMGIAAIPSHVIGDSLTETFVLQELNTKACFDFEFVPQDGDNLTIQFKLSKYDTEFLSFIYRNNGWEPGTHDPFMERTEPKNFGELKILV